MGTKCVYKLILIACFAISTVSAQNPWDSDTLTLFYPKGVQSINDKVFVYDITPTTGPERYKLWVKENDSTGWAYFAMPALTAAFHFYDEQKGWALVDTAYRAPRIWYTKDGGQNWIAGFQFPKDYSVPFTSNNIQLLGGDTGYFGTQGYLFKSTDGGIIFDLVYDSQNIFDVIGFANTQIGWVGYSIGGLERTNDGGISWGEQSPDINSISTIHVFNENTIFVGGENAIAYSTDGGANWITKSVPVEPPYRFITKIQYTPPTIWILYANKIWYSIYGTTDWGISSQSNLTKKGMEDDIEIIDFYMKDDKKGWAITSQGLWVYDITSGVENDQRLLSKMLLSPNPFNEYTTITFRVLKRSTISLKVYNMLGQEITSLVNEALDPGEYSKVFASADLPEGIYLVRLSSEDSSYTNKMLLLK